MSDNASGNGRSGPVYWITFVVTGATVATIVDRVFVNDGLGWFEKDVITFGIFLVGFLVAERTAGVVARWSRWRAKARGSGRDHPPAIP